MSILEIDQKDLASLSIDDSEELLLRLCEAEVQARGYSARHTRLSGKTSAPDGGIDVQIAIPDKKFRGDFVPCSETIFQVKNTKVAPSDIKAEITKHPDLFTSLADSGGAYIIACLKECHANEQREHWKNSSCSSII